MRLVRSWSSTLILVTVLLVAHSITQEAGRSVAASQIRDQWEATSRGLAPGGLPIRSGEDQNLVPINDLGVNTYKGAQGGLYPGGSNVPPQDYLSLGLEQAQKVQPLGADGQPDPRGKIVLLSLGMSNTTMEFSYFRKIADADPRKNPNLVIVDGAQGGQDAKIIRNSSAAFWRKVDDRLRQAGVSREQVQVVWLKEAVAGENRAFPKDALYLKDALSEIIDNIRQFYPNVRIVYLSSRIYGGYAKTTLNPEPFAYESGFAVKWLIEDKISSPDSASAPWLAWGPYLWADGLSGRSDGLVWEPSDFAVKDGTHPSQSGVEKVAGMLLEFFTTDQTAKGWFLKGE